MKKLVFALLLVIVVIFACSCDASDVGVNITGEKGEPGDTPYIGGER